MKPTLLLAAIPLLAFSAASQAAFILIDNFQSYSTGNLGGQGNWVSNANPAKSTVVDNAGNKSGQLTSGDPTSGPLGSSIYNNSGGLAIANNTTGTLFFQFTVTNFALVDLSLGLSDVATPATNTFGDYEAQISLTSAGIRVRNGGAFTTSTALTSGVTYDLWLVANNTTDTSNLYIQGGAFSSQTLLFSNFGFRNGTSNTISTFLALGGSTASSTLRIDNIYMDNAGSNLLNPVAVPEPGTYAMLLGGICGLILLRRRRSS